MELNDEKTINILIDSYKEINQQLLPQQRIEPTKDTVLIGDEAKLDSMALVTYLVVVEGKISEKYKKEITILGDDITFDEINFKNIEVLGKYINNVLRNKSD